MRSEPAIREILPKEHASLGQLMVDVYSNLKGFPTPAEQPAYYTNLERIGELNLQQHTTVFVALMNDKSIVGGVVYYDDMSMYGAGGKATKIENASGIRLLGVANQARGMGVGKALMMQCIDRARTKGNQHIILHTTDAMKVAWGLYIKLGFERSTDLDFLQENLSVYGFRLRLEQ